MSRQKNMIDSKGNNVVNLPSIMSFDWLKFLNWLKLKASRLFRIISIESSVYFLKNSEDLSSQQFWLKFSDESNPLFDWLDNWASFKDPVVGIIN